MRAAHRRGANRAAKVVGEKPYTQRNDMKGSCRSRATRHERGARDVDLCDEASASRLRASSDHPRRYARPWLARGKAKKAADPLHFLWNRAMHSAASSIAQLGRKSSSFKPRPATSGTPLDKRRRASNSKRDMARTRAQGSGGRLEAVPARRMRKHAAPTEPPTCAHALMSCASAIDNFQLAFALLWAFDKSWSPLSPAMQQGTSLAGCRLPPARTSNPDLSPPRTHKASPSTGRRRHRRRPGKQDAPAEGLARSDPQTAIGLAPPPTSTSPSQANVYAARRAAPAQRGADFRPRFPRSVGMGRKRYPEWRGAKCCDTSQRASDGLSMSK